MIEAFQTTDVYAAEAALMAELPEGELMARAVEGLIEVTAARLEQLGGRRVVALVGSGNNGADALYAASGLAAAGVSCAAVHRAGAVHAGALEAARGAGVVLVADDAKGVDAGTLGEEARSVLAEADIVLDGILGIGGRGGLPRWGATWVAEVPDTAYVIAVDLPSGQDPNGGVLSADGIFADETVTFSVAKPVHLLPPTEAAVGRLTVVDIGLELGAGPSVLRLTHDDVAGLWPVPTAGDDKYTRGVLGIIAGGEEFTGAAVLSVTAAVEAGVGMVRYVGTPSAEAMVRAAVPEAVIGVGRVQAWVIGPGLDPSSRAAGAKAQRDAAHEALAGAEPVLVDAGGLDLLEASVLAARAADGRVTLLTPHAGECARLLSRLADREISRAEVEAAPVEHARRLAELTGAVVLLKGSTTLVVSPGSASTPGVVFSQADGPVWLATAGSGDVLAGVIGAVLATGVDAAPAAALGALVHGVAADRANPGGPVRALAVAGALPATIAGLLRR